MSGALGFAALTSGEFRKRRDRLIDFLDAWGDLRVKDLGAGGARRLLDFELEAPGQALAAEVKVRYSEYYRRNARGHWDLAKYHYEFFDIDRGKRLAYHLHDIGSRKLVPHVHCEDSTDPTTEEGPHHLRAIVLDLREAHERFMKLYAAEVAPDCSEFPPLEVPRTS